MLNTASNPKVIWADMLYVANGRFDSKPRVCGGGVPWRSGVRTMGRDLAATKAARVGRYGGVLCTTCHLKTSTTLQGHTNKANEKRSAHICCTQPLQIIAALCSNSPDRLSAWCLLKFRDMRLHDVGEKHQDIVFQHRQIFRTVYFTEHLWVN